MGPKGAKGDTGAAATVQVGNTNTGAPGTNAQVTNAGNEHFAVFNFTIPRGDKGEKGATGAQGAKGDKGDKGDAGTAATIAVGSTTTTNPGTNATVTNSGTTSAAVLNFGIPRGATGSVKSDVVAELPETGEEDTFYLVNREATEQTATGKAISFTNNDNAGDITDFKLDGETSQNGTPTPDAPVPVNTTTGENVVKICGKNIWTLASSFQNTSSSVAWVLGDTAVSFQPGTYTFSCTSTASSDVNIINYKYADNADHYIAFKDAASLTFESEVKKIAISLGGNVSISNIQLELGSTATAYEPYQGQSYEVNLGKNLLNSGGVVQITGQIQSDKTLNTSSGSTVYMLCRPNTTYVFSKTQSTRTRLGTAANLLDSSHNLTNYVAGTSTTPGGRQYGVITSGPQDKYIYLTYSEYDNMAVETVQGQLEIGNEPSDYESSAPIELCKIGDYQDYIYKSGDKWYKHKAVGKVVYNGTEDWQIYNGFMFLYEPSFILSYGNNGYMPTNYLSDNFTRNSLDHSLNDRDASYLVQNVWGERDKQRGVAMATNNTFTDLSAWKTWLGSHNTTIYYQLDNPTEEEITNATLITQLDNVASAPLYAGVNNITTITTNEQGTLEIKYVTYDKYNQNKVYIWNDTLQQWQIIVP
jgi:hypothetical protein